MCSLKVLVALLALVALLHAVEVDSMVTVPSVPTVGDIGGVESITAQIAQLQQKIAELLKSGAPGSNVLIQQIEAVIQALESQLPTVTVTLPGGEDPTVSNAAAKPTHQPLTF